MERLNKAAVEAAAKAAGPGAIPKDHQDAAAAAQAARDAKAALRETDADGPVIPRLLADDITPEATASLLADNGGRIAIVSTEGGIFDTIAGRYAKAVNMDVYLKGHSGDPIRVDRQGRDPQHIPSPALTMGLMVQPRIIEAIGGNHDFMGRGLLARILYAKPVSMVGHRTIGAATVTAETELIYRNTVTQLASDMAGWQGDPAILVLDPAAEAAVRRIETKVEPTLAGEGQLPHRPCVPGVVSTSARWFGLRACCTSPSTGSRATGCRWPRPPSAVRSVSATTSRPPRSMCSTRWPTRRSATPATCWAVLCPWVRSKCPSATCSMPVVDRGSPPSPT